MAYQTRRRDPLLDSHMQAAIERRGKELLGLAVIAAGVAAAMMIASYTPEDPSWMLATDAPVQNWLGRFGASLAQPLFMIVGAGAWGIPLVLIAWGLRLAAHMGEDRAVGRLIFAPIAVALASVYASTLAPGPEWTHSFGLGGLFGDTVLSIALTMMPFGPVAGVKLVSFVTGVAMLGLGAFVLGFTLREMRLGLRYFIVGLVLAYDIALRLLGRGAAASLRGAQQATTRVQSTIEARREARSEARQDAVAQSEPALRATRAARSGPALIDEEEEDDRPAPRPGRDDMPAPRAGQRAAVVRAEPPLTPQQGARAMPPALQGASAGALRDFAAPPRPTAAAAAGPLGGLRALVPSLLRRGDRHGPMPEPELVEQSYDAGEVDPVDEARVRARIGDAIRNRMGRAAPDAARQEPVLRRSQPLALDLGPRAVPPPPESFSADPFAAEPFLAGTDWPDEADVLEAGYGDIDGLPAPAPTGTARAPLTADPLFDTEEEDEAYPAEAGAMPPRPVPLPETRKVVQHLSRKPVQPSARARSEAQPGLPLDGDYPAYDYPPLNLLTNPAEVERHHLSDEALEENARMLESVLDDYGVKGEIVSVRPGPVVTMYELEPAPGLKASRVIGLADDIARSMSALSARVSTVPGRSVIGIELPNAHREKVVLREILSARDFGDSNMRLPLALGKDIGGEPIIANLAKMPHLLIAGTTGSGKSVAINTMILSLLYKLTPEECRLIMIDPKMLELSVYDGIPHLLSPVVTDPKKAVVALKWVVGEMEERYRKMSKMGVRNIEGYNARVRDTLARGEMFSRTVQTGFDDETGEPVFETEEFLPVVLPYIVVIVDEMADLMMVAGKEIEACIQRLAQMARASGIHLIMATQRPSVDVITGTIKANFPTRISFQVTSKIDSRTILGEQGAEQLLGMGDMLYMAGGSRITRIHGPFCSDEEVEEIVNFLKGFGPPEYMSGVVEGPDEDAEGSIDQVLGLGGGSDGEDALYDMAVQIVAKDRKCSTSYIQRKLAIGYNKAARLVEQMEDQGVVSPANHVGKREILVPEPQ